MERRVADVLEPLDSGRLKLFLCDADKHRILLRRHAHSAVCSRCCGFAPFQICYGHSLCWASCRESALDVSEKTLVPRLQSSIM